MTLNPSFIERRVLVTGGARGIGLAISKKFLNAGASVTILDQDESQLEEAVKSHPGLKAVKVNILDWEETRKVVEEIGSVHHLVNNAGIARPAEELLNVKPESIDEIFGVNFKGALNVTQVVAKGMIADRLENATIVNISSISDAVAVPGLLGYSCSKAAVTMLTKCSALELGPYGIRVNCVRPAMVKTEQVGRLAGNASSVLQHVIKINERKATKRLVEMEEVADAVLFLSSSSSAMVNGSDILLDGGLFTN